MKRRAFLLGSAGALASVGGAFSAGEGTSALLRGLVSPGGAGLAFAFNLKPGAGGNMAPWRAGRAGVLGGTSRALAIGAGDSNEVAAGAGSADGAGTWTVGAAPLSKIKTMGDNLAGVNIPTNWQTFAGMMGLSTIAAVKAWDARLSNMANWIVGDLTIAQRFFQSPSPQTDPLTFTPTSSAVLDSYKTWFERGASRGQFTVTDGGVATTVDCTGVTGFINASGALNGRASGKVLALNRTTFNTNPVHIGETVFFDSLTSAVDLVNAGWYGSKTGDWISTANPWSPLNALVTITPNVVFLTLGANDLNQGVAIGTILANLSTIVTALVAAGIAVVLVHEASGSPPTWGTAQNQADLVAGMQLIALAQNIVLMDEDAVLGGFAVANANGDMKDGIHLSAQGCAKIGLARAQLLLAA